MKKFLIEALFLGVSERGEDHYITIVLFFFKKKPESLYFSNLIFLQLTFDFLFSPI